MMNIDCIIEEFNYYANNVTIAKDDEQIEAHKMVEESWYRDYQALAPGGPGRDYQALAPLGGPGRDYQALSPLGGPGRDYQLLTPGRKQNDKKVLDNS